MLKKYLMDFRLFQRDNRLTACSVNKKEWDEILRMSR
jgi:hypothetical protein